MTQVITKEQVLEEIKKNLDSDLSTNELNGTYGIEVMIGVFIISATYYVDAEVEFYDEYETNVHECNIVSAHATVSEFQIWNEEIEEEVDILTKYEVEDYIQEYIHECIVY